MTAFLLTVSFVLHALSLFIIILLYLQLSKVKEVERRQSQLSQEMEQTISAYLLEWKEENERFLQALSKKMDNGSEKKDVDRSPSIKNRSEKRNETEWLPPMESIEQMKDEVEIRAAKQTKSVSTPPPPMSLEEQAIALQKEGKTIEEIAKLLNKGKTEIELLLKFRGV
ncbi:hypothetical protein [Anoxybacteroides tepidamans]|uniref:hypothetical protein n=1 Tax=Anoxybacteroides tepidamans TaxID=265948 RepID=UPI000487AE55|nr:hypothetical protein [Anoxybacillus tepidamans]